VSAGYVLVSSGRRHATELIGAVIGTPTEAGRDADSVRLMDWGFSLYEKRVPVRPGKTVVSVPVRFEDEDLDLVTGTSVRVGVREGERLKVSTDVPAEVEGPIEKGERLGSATVTVDGERIQTVRLFAPRSIAEPGLIDRLTEKPVYVVAIIVLLLFGILGVLAILRRRRESSMRRRLRRVARSKR
ncbi:MAG: hypothetical protein M3Y23_07115, partial [Actinomycetota bacterium]|nr:hypothetical protein [Actinomycetota bacterium]